MRQNTSSYATLCIWPKGKRKQYVFSNITHLKPLSL